LFSSTPIADETGFIAMAKRGGANALLGLFLATDRFDSSLKGLKVDSIDTVNGAVRCSFTATRAISNSYDTLHGGATCLLVDIVGTIALLAKDPTRAGVSVEISTSFLSAAKVGEELVAEGRVLKVGRSLGFTQVDIRTKEGKLIATGRHTKAL
jgi:acyl-coenzyme A thioesterase 13